MCIYIGRRQRPGLSAGQVGYIGSNLALHSQAHEAFHNVKPCEPAMLLIATFEALPSLVSHQTTDKRGFGGLWRTGLIGGGGSIEFL